MKIQRVGPEEVQDAADVFTRSIVTLLRGILRPDQIRKESDYRGYFVSTIAKDNDVWAAVIGEKIAGILALDEEWIDQLYIDPDFQRQGVGSALIERAKALRPDGLRVLTLQRNTVACEFYRRRGFIEYRRGVSPPPENEPDVWFVWPA